MSEHGYRVRPRSAKGIARAAEQFLREHAPEHLAGGGPLDVATLVDHRLQNAGIMVYPVSPDDLPDAEAETRASEGRWVEIWMREEFYDALFQDGTNTNRARSTLAHEIGHAVLHKAEVRTGRELPAALALRRAPRSKLKPYEDSEWQAYMFAGALLMPRPALRQAPLNDQVQLAIQFGVSEAFVRSHLSRIRRVL